MSELLVEDPFIESHSDRSISSRISAREELEDLTADFLANGGDIQYIDPGVRTKVYVPWNKTKT